MYDNVPLSYSSVCSFQFRKSPISKALYGRTHFVQMLKGQYKKPNKYLYRLQPQHLLGLYEYARE